MHKSLFLSLKVYSRLFLFVIKKEMCFKSEEETHNLNRYKRVSQSQVILAVLFYQSGGSRGTIGWKFHTVL